MPTTEDLHEPIDVLTAFENGAVRPVKFRWNGRVVPVERVAYQWITRDGAHPVRHFAVLAPGGTAYEIALHTHTLRWTLLSVQMEG